MFSLEYNGYTWRWFFRLFFCFFELYGSRQHRRLRQLRAPSLRIAGASCSYYSRRRQAKPVGIVLPCVCCSRTRYCCVLCFVDDHGRQSSLFGWMIIFWIFSTIQQQTPQANATATGTVAAGQHRPRAPTTLAGTAASR